MSAELVELRSFYAFPGFILLARQEGEPVGCVAVRSLAPSTGELRRLYVRPGRRSGGLGRRLLTTASDVATERGMGRLVLTTLLSMEVARSLYDSEGFHPIQPYVDDPLEGLQFLGRDL
ncbi:MAG TPA: GNAT family N-acetyltransferase [Nocardioidaceae bacterium]|jgi:GNAT superfamily N-acetyltransferase|nr:GNAT family N-acetyltransferase [Nocardioidaceae bacterium]